VPIWHLKGKGESVTQETTQEKIMASLRAELTLTRKLLAQRLTHDNKQDYL
jgi:hypothetical protein